jgi:endoglucanase
MKKRIVSLLIVLTFIFALVPAAAIPASAAFTPITGMEMMEKLGVGINIGNTFDANPLPNWWAPENHMDFETSWGQPRVEKWHLEAIAMKGFDSVRIPVAWEPQIDSSGRIYKEWMDRIQQVVDWALEAGLYVVLNSHHEWNFRDNIWTDFDRAERWLVNTWAQIAERFKDYPAALIFEPMNEPMNIAWTTPHNQASADRVNRLNASALEVIRKSGGNNNRRVVALTVLAAQTDSVPFYIHPENDPYVMLGIFYYPVHAHFGNFKAALDKGIPMLNKETAPLVIGGINDGNRLPNWEKWIADTYGALAELGIPSMWWDHMNDGGWWLFNRSTGEWNTPLVNAFFAAYGRTPGADFKPPVNLPYTLRGPFNDSAFTFWEDVPGVELAAAERIVVEFTGTFSSGFMFALHHPNPWAQFDENHLRVTTEPGRIIFDIRELEGNTLGFAAWGAGDAAKITRIYLDTWAGSAFTTADALTILRAAAGLQTLTAEQFARYDLDGDGRITTADALIVLRRVAGI